jgi:RNA polymerase sigma factor (TIGR02999 family)
MSYITRILSAIEQGALRSAELLLPLAYDELRSLAAQRLAQESPGQTLQATAWVHEAYLRLVAPAGGGRGPPVGMHWEGRRHFFAAAAEAMRRILINRARDRGRVKRGGSWLRLHLDNIELSVADPPDELLLLDDDMDKLAREDSLSVPSWSNSTSSPA